jgi:pimeloyl-ACP methyl ester carboxylesterase
VTPNWYTSAVDTNQTISLTSGRSVGFADYGTPGETAVIWCHGGPGSRLAPAYMASAAIEAGLRLVGIDRPGYGLSMAEPGRTIGGWVPDALAVADHLGIDRFVTVGTSTGGAYALAVAALAPERVLGVVACCAMTDMRYQPARATMSRPHAHAVWDAPDRDSAIAAAVESHGHDGSKIIESAQGPPLAPSDLAMVTGHPWGRQWMAAVPAMFAQGLAGYADDRIADGPGWVTFDVADVTSPVIVLHGARDVICDPIHARHTAAIVPHAELRILEDLGHLSIEDHIVPTIIDLLAEATRNPGGSART